MFPAHIRDGIAGKAIQTAEEHSRKTAKYAGESLYGAGLENAAALAGLVHDCGKFKTEFAEYIEGADGTRGSVNHTFAGFRLLMERYHGETVQTAEDVTAELLALAAGGHHGLFDCVNENKESGMLQRMSKKNIAIFGSTGSIGESTLNVIRENPNLFKVVTLVAGKNVEKLINQINEFKPKNAYIIEKENAEYIKKLYKDINVQTFSEICFYIIKL